MEPAKRTASSESAFIFLALGCTVLIAGAALLFHSFLTHRYSAPGNTISEIISNPTAWEDKEVELGGSLQMTTIGIIQPFNYWLTDRENQTVRIGVKWHSKTDLSGTCVRVIGVVRRGYAWVHPDHAGWWVYFVEASTVYDTL